MIRKDVLEDFVIDIIIKELSRENTMDTLISNLLREQERQCTENTRLLLLQREKAKVEKALENLVTALEQGIISATTNKRLHELEKQQAELERDILIEQSKIITKIPEKTIRAFYIEALRQEREMLVNLLVREIILYNDRIEIYFHTPLKNGPDDDRGCSFFVGYEELSFVAYRKIASIENMQVEMFA